MPVYEFYGLWCIADSRVSAVTQIARHLETSTSHVARFCRRVKGPFNIQCCGAESDVSEQDFCEIVDRDEDGIVTQGE